MTTAWPFPVVELGGPGSGNPNQARIAAGQTGGGRFTKSGQGGQSRSQRHPASSSGAARLRQKQALLDKARDDRKQAHQLTLQLQHLMALQRASNRRRAQATRAGRTGKTASSTPAKKTGTAAAAKKGAAAAAGKASSSTATASTGTGRSYASQISQLRAKIKSLLAAAAQATRQAAAL